MPDERGESPEHGMRRPTRAEFLTGGATVLASLVAPLALSGCASEERRAQDPALEALRHTDPRLVRYHQTARFATGLRSSRGIAVAPDDTLYCAGDDCVVALHKGKPLPVAGTSAPPTCVATARDGAVLVGAGDHVESLHPGGGQLTRWPALGPGAVITAIAAGLEEIYVADAGYKRITRHDASGRMVGAFGAKSADGYSGLVVPSPHLDVAVGADGVVYVTNPGMHRVEAHAPNGQLRSSWGAASSDLSGFCGCCNPTDFTLLPDGRFATAEKGIPRVKVHRADGAFDGMVAGPEQFASSTMGIDLAADSEGRIYVLDARANEVRVYTPNA